MITLAHNKICTGCSACAEVCATGAITMKEDKEGFLFPVIDEGLCASCKRCVDACPLIKADKRSKSDGEVFAVRAVDEDFVAKSSSGGIFGVLAKNVIASGGVVYGAGYDDNLKVVHKRALTEDEIKGLMGSKYVQSDINGCYKSVKKDLEDNKKVLFAGTPCQCAGLSGYLSKVYSNLIMIDFVCHGVPSPGLFRKYLGYMSENGEIIKVRFRDKTTDRKKGHCISIEYKNAPVYRELSVKDPYMLGFLQNINLRKSCYNCAFKGFGYYWSDITLGDFWGIEKTDSVLSQKDGVSLVITNTDKGKTFFESIEDKVLFDKRTEEEAVKENKSLITSTLKNPLRDKYLKDMNKMNIEKLRNKYCSDSYTAKLRRLIAKRRKDR